MALASRGPVVRCCQKCRRFGKSSSRGSSWAGVWGYENPGYGLTWWVSVRDGERFFARAGSVSGYTAFASGNRTRGFGVAFLANGNRAHPLLVRLTGLVLDLLAHELGESR